MILSLLNYEQFIGYKWNNKQIKFVGGKINGEGFKEGVVIGFHLWDMCMEIYWRP